jgi:hypothetical protein
LHEPQHNFADTVNVAASANALAAIAAGGLCKFSCRMMSFVVSHRNLELCKTLKTTTEQFSLFSTEQFGGRRIKSGTRGKPPRRVRVTATRAWAQLAGVCASKMLPYIIFFMPLVRSQPVSRAAASLGPKGPAVLRRRCEHYHRAPRDSWQHVS